jgi:hypothetical protein
MADSTFLFSVASTSSLSEVIGGFVQISLKLNGENLFADGGYAVHQNRLRLQLRVRHAPR